MAEEQEFFISPSKLQTKGEKIIKKDSLRRVYSSKKIIQSSQDQEILDQIKAKATKWWNKLNSKYFNAFTQKDLIKYKEQLMNDKNYDIQSANNKLGTFFQEEISIINPKLFLLDTMRILFRKEIKLDEKEEYLLVSYGLGSLQDQTNRTMKNQEQQLQNFGSFQTLLKKIGKSDSQLLQQIDKNIHLLSFRNISKKSLNIDCQTLSKINIEPIQIQEREQVIFKLLKYQVSKRQTNNEIERQIKMWQNRLQKNNLSNNQNWKILANFINNPSEDQLKINKSLKQQEKLQIQKIKKELLWSQILLYIKSGHSDKTEEMLDGAMEVMIIKEMSMKQSQRKRKNTKIQKLKCLFQTDCKICFNTESDDKNKVFYCDKCNTSFHQSCYGIKSQEIEKGQPFYCDVCKYLISQQKITQNKAGQQQNNSKLNDQIKLRKPRCQICTNSNFPMKKLDNHFYHITCLFLFGYVKIQNDKLQLKDNYNHAKIVQQVIQNEISTNPCEVCSKFNGNKFKCQIENCQSYYHPICAYLNGQLFQIDRNFRNLKTFITCSKHLENRNFINQMYIRRFFCDYKNTSNTGQEDFKLQYQKEVEERQYFKAKQKKIENKLLKKWKMIKIKMAKSDPLLQKKKSSQMDIQNEQKLESFQQLEQV